MGHISGIRAIYARFDQATEYLEEKYLESEPNLSIFENTTTMIELRKHIEDKNQYVDDLIKKLYRDNSRMESNINSMNQEITELKASNQKHIAELLKLFNNVYKLENEIKLLKSS